VKRQICITPGPATALAGLATTKTTDAVWEALPLSGSTNRRGEEIYFALRVKMKLEEGHEIVNPGDLGYWPRGNATLSEILQTKEATALRAQSCTL